MALLRRTCHGERHRTNRELIPNIHATYWAYQARDSRTMLSFSCRRRHLWRASSSTDRSSLQIRTTTLTTRTTPQIPPNPY
ncbi:hypothetical protein F2Q69_00000317 [Brassica cretica]|uniref:Uncharacterized protein n=1 Tax=Brassica cretica TaxID=69181 RepID=A0A8S9PE78_BRACR|nr:hypothetical protein F2Q69_00000317 [Brassica cretica]